MDISLRNLCYNGAKVNIGSIKMFSFAKEIYGRYANDFELYGDAVSFDATFDTNRYNMIFVPFTGVDKHYRCVTFTACLLSHENQCPAMKVAVRDVFSDVNGLVATKHRLCMWHIMEKFPVKLGNQLCKETNFMEKMKMYIWSPVIKIEEFERGWETVLKEFNLEISGWKICML
ncbi:protein FAR1-RELATED SEQUENCE 5-like [Apium graveolens]|uniref:protein FAR1-RELATED SEQUENCE 5-like n=1 Tax=Apium graveolens TaxID=4045 RepID=UPI003D7905A7